jgi:hypothetical protein
MTRCGRSAISPTVMRRGYRWLSRLACWRDWPRLWSNEKKRGKRGKRGERGEKRKNRENSEKREEKNEFLFLEKFLKK